MKDILIRELGDRIKKINNIVCEKEIVALKQDSTLPHLDNLTLNSNTSIKEEIQMNDDRLLF